MTNTPRDCCSDVFDGGCARDNRVGDVTRVVRNGKERKQGAQMIRVERQQAVEKSERKEPNAAGGEELSEPQGREQLAAALAVERSTGHVGGRNLLLHPIRQQFQRIDNLTRLVEHDAQRLQADFVPLVRTQNTIQIGIEDLVDYLPLLLVWQSAEHVSHGAALPRVALTRPPMRRRGGNHAQVDESGHHRLVLEYRQLRSRTPQQKTDGDLTALLQKCCIEVEQSVPFDSAAVFHCQKGTQLCPERAVEFLEQGFQIDVLRPQQQDDLLRNVHDAAAIFLEMPDVRIRIDFHRSTPS